MLCKQMAIIGQIKSNRFYLMYIVHVHAVQLVAPHQQLTTLRY